MEEWIFKLLEGIQAGTIGYAGIVTVVCIYLYMQNQRLQKEFTEYLRGEIDKNDKREALSTEIIGVLSSLNSKVRKTSL
jgi:hypothetical protein